MNETTNKPGSGALFHRKDAKDQWLAKATPRARKLSAMEGIVAMFNGEITLPGGQRMLVQANFVERLGHFEAKLVDPDNWKTMSEFTIPAFNGQNYVDTKMPVDQRKYTLRAIKAEYKDEDGLPVPYIRLRMPQVVQVSSAHRAFS